MNPIVLSVTIGDDRRLVIDLPLDTPVGKAEVVIKPARTPISEMPDRPMTREEAREILLKAGFLVTSIKAPEGYVPLSPEELLEIGRLPPGARPSEELIDEDRGEY